MLRAGMLQIIQGDRQGKERGWSSQGKVARSLEALGSKRFWVTGSLCPGCSVSLISSWKTSHETPTKAGVRPQPTSCHNQQFAEATVAAPGGRGARPHCQSPAGPRATARHVARRVGNLGVLPTPMATDGLLRGCRA